MKWLKKDLVFLVTQVRLSVLNGRRGFTDYSIVVPSSGWRLGFRTSGRAKGLTAAE
ncbi:hypothetical protein Hanom_Chr02g00112081 [Helianthus anomalus]